MMIKKSTIHFLLLMVFIGHNSNAQITFQEKFCYNSSCNSGHIGYSGEQTNDGGYIISGSAAPDFSGITSIFMIKTDSLGSLIWDKTFEGSLYQARAYTVHQTFDGGFILAGEFILTPSSSEAYLIKTNSIGDTLWTKSFGGASQNVANSIQQTSDSGYIVVGSTRTFGAGLQDIYLVKFDSIGNMIWSKEFGGSGVDVGNSVRQTNDGGYIIAGNTESFGAGRSDAFLLKTDANGDTLWTRTFGGMSDDFGNSVLQTSDSGFIVVGTSYSSGLVPKAIYIIKTNMDGDTMWTKALIGTGLEIGYSIQSTFDGNYIISGTSYGSEYTACLIKINSNGDILWAKEFGEQLWNLTGYSVVQSRDRGYFITGDFYSVGSNQSSAINLIKTDENGIVAGCIQPNSSVVVASFITQVSKPGMHISTGFISSNYQTSNGNNVANLSVDCFSNGIDKEITDESGLILQNPFTTELSIKGTKQNGSAIIYDITGEEILRQKTFESETKINTSDFSNGIYILDYIDEKENGNVKVKLVKF